MSVAPVACSIAPTPAGEALGELDGRADGALDGALDGPGDPLEAEPEQATTTMARTAMAAARACCDMAPRRSRGRNGSTRRFGAF